MVFCSCFRSESGGNKGACGSQPDLDIKSKAVPVSWERQPSQCAYELYTPRPDRHIH
jgi:hypothetical protein